MKKHPMKPPAFKPSASLPQVIRQLEFLCESRNRKELRKGIRYLAGHFRMQPRLRNRCLDWYWRSGLLAEGLRLASPDFSEITKRRSSDTLHTLGTERALFYLVFLANLSGTPWVIRWLSQEEHSLVKSPKDWLIIANLWTSCREFARAKQSLKRYQAELKSSPESEGLSQSRMVPMTLGYIHYQLGEFRQAAAAYDRALKLISSVGSPLTFLDATLMRLLSETRARPSSARSKARETLLADFDGAIEAQENLLQQAPRLHAAFTGRKAVLLGVLGMRVEARLFLAKAQDLLCSSLPDSIPERRLLLLHELAPLNVLTQEEWGLLLTHPGAPDCSPSLKQGLLAEIRPNRARLLVSMRKLPRDSYRISPRAFEYQIGSQSFHYGIPKEIELLALIRRAGALGIHRNLAMALLWPEQGTLIRELVSRLAQIIQRLRHVHGFDVRVERECLALSGPDLKRVIVDQDSPRPLALSLHPPTPLSSEWISKTYRVGTTQARKILKEWEQRQWIETSGRGAKTRYQVLP
jgi:tetratricopeptide (TPR) repeat protein